METSPQAAAQAEAVTGSQIHVGTLDTASYRDGWFGKGVSAMAIG